MDEPWKNVSPSERIQTDTVCFHIEGPRIHKPWETGDRLVSTGAERRGDERNLTGMGFPRGSLGMFWKSVNVLVAQYDESTKCH